uniref:Uncharacterized protein n=1 Tax=Pithovirus LCPAC406 TaxID=2506599 RepID=A0A481ZDK3_9VIRU|nr:MAG: uncharacterized protein LCPAC406_03180 [Pithovirus LCPAC406]
MSISEEKFYLLELNESEERVFIINKISLITDPENWPVNSMPRLMYEGDKDAPEYVISNFRMKMESIELIRSVVLKDTKGPVLNLIDTDWNNIELTVRYLGLGVGIDFLYPLFLVPDDRVIWYDECESRISHVCQYRSEDDGDLLEMNLDDVVTTDSPYITLNNLNLHPEKLERVRESDEKGEITDENQNMSDLIDEIVQTLSSVPDLLVVRDVALARFRGIRDLIKKPRRQLDVGKTGRSKRIGLGIGSARFSSLTPEQKERIRKQYFNIAEVTNVDVFAYGPDAREHIIESVRLCVELSKHNFREFYQQGREITFMDVKGRLTPNRTRHRIVVPVMSRSTNRITLNVVFPLVRLHSKRDILTKIPLDCFAIGFDPRNPNMFYGLPRTYRSLDTMTNVVDPTRNGIKYFDILSRVSNTGFDIAIPGFNIDDIGELPCSDKILKVLNLAISAKLLEEEGEYTRLISTKSYSQILDDFDKNNKSVRKIERKLTDMNLSGLVLLLARAILGGLVTYDRNMYSSFEIAMEHGGITVPFLIRSIYKHPDRARVIFGDVLNQGKREFRITVTRRSPTGNYINENLTYIPLFPRIELLSFDLEAGLYQVKTAFYGQYTCMEDIYVSDDVDRGNTDVYEMLNLLSQRTL